MMAGHEVFERPQSRRAHRNSTTGFIEREPEQINERPASRRSRRSSVPVNYSGPSPRHSGSDPSQSVTPRPPLSQKPKSRLRQNQRTSSQDHGLYQREGEFYSGSSASSRPSTASSLSRYTPLPSIGSKLDLFDSPRSDADDDLPDRVNKVKINDPNVKKETRGQKVTGQGQGGENSLAAKSRRNSRVKQEKSDASHKENSDRKTSKTSTQEDRKTSRTSTQEETVNNKSENDNSDALNSFKPLKRKIKLPPEPSGKDEHVTLAVKLPTGQRIQRSFLSSNTLRTVMEFAEYTSKMDFSGCQLACSIPVKLFRELNKTIKECGIEDRTVFHIHVPD